MNEVIGLAVLGESKNDCYKVWLKFNDGEEGIIDLRPYLGKGFSAELLTYEKFKQVFIEPGGGIAWDNGYDFCPNFLKELAAKKESEQAVNV